MGSSGPLTSDRSSSGYTWQREGDAGIGRHTGNSPRCLRKIVWLCGLDVDAYCVYVKSIISLRTSAFSAVVRQEAFYRRERRGTQRTFLSESKPEWRLLKSYMPHQVACPLFTRRRRVRSLIKVSAAPLRGEKFRPKRQIQPSRPMITPPHPCPHVWRCKPRRIARSSTVSRCRR